MRKITILQGLPSSGKTTWAKEQVRMHPNVKRVNKDDLRVMIDGGKYSKLNEEFVLEVRDDLIFSAINFDYDVIVDDTNLHQKHIDHITEMVKYVEGAKLETKFFPVSVEEAINRDAKRDKPVGEKVIMDMYNTFLKKEFVAEQDNTLPPAIIVDIDGTIADHGGRRGHFDYMKVGEDLPIMPIVHLVKSMAASHKIIFMSGRDKVCLNATVNWLMEYVVEEFELYMRGIGDTRKDTIVKKELYEKYVKDNYFVHFVLEDRQKAVDMWRSEVGLRCLQVQDGKY